MSPLPVRMRNRWADRLSLPTNRGTIYWHVLMSAHPEVCSAAIDMQNALEDFSGLHMTPRKWLHMTILIAGSTDDITRDHMSAMLASAQRSLRDISAIPATIGKILYHPEAIMLRLEPAQALQSLLDAAQSATQATVGHTGTIDEQPPTWIPHVTIAYSTADQPAGPIISALGRSVPEREILIDSLNLVIQWGPEKLWNWEPVGTARLGTSG
jgi:2'-5' RNA ligase